MLEYVCRFMLVSPALWSAGYVWHAVVMLSNGLYTTQGRTRMQPVRHRSELFCDCAGLH